MALQNDWIVAGINNPDFTVSDFANFADMTTENTQLLGVDDYIKTDFIQNHPYFQDDAGNFNEDLFRNYYAARAQEFDTFAQDEFYRGPALDMFDLDRTQETPVKDIGFNITRGFNPDRQQIGIEGVNVWSDPKFSQRELAKQNRVFNTERGEFEDWSVDDHTLASNVRDWFRDLWRDPLVLATWDEDGMHVDPMTGLPQQHVKGQPKLNDKGTYYYETLGDRSVLGKDVLSVFDTLTVDGEGMNRYDFFDSNDLRKSVGGTIMKNVVALLPMFIPGVAPVYSGVLLARELAKTLPMLSGMVTSLTGGETPQWAETASAWAQRATTSMSDEAMRKPFAFEHFAGLVSDLAMLTGQQKLIAETFGAMRGGQRYIEEATLNARRLYESKALEYGAGPDVWRACLSRFMPQAQKMATRSGQLGRDLGLAYIALTFQHSTYDEMLQRGASKQEASAVALGAMLGMFSVDKWLHLGEIFYSDATGDATKMARRIAREQADRMVRGFGNKKGLFSDIFKGGETGEMKLLKMIREARDGVRAKFGEYADAFRYHTLTASGKMIGSGVERVAETLVSDLSKGMYELAGQFGAPTTVKDAGSFENMTERYGMAFLAGVLGAGVHYGTELVKSGTLQVPKLQESIETLVRNGYADELRAEVNRLERSGLTGSRRLAATDPVKDDKGKVIGWRTAKHGEMTQGAFIAKLMRDNITSLEAMFGGEARGMTDDELFEHAVMGERRLMMYRKLADFTGLFDRAAETWHAYIKASDEYGRASRTLKGTLQSETTADDGSKVMVDNPVLDDVENEIAKLSATAKEDRESNLKPYRDALDEARKALDRFLGGDASLDYVRELSFTLDHSLSDRFLGLDVDKKSREWFGKPFAELGLSQVADFNSRWDEFRKTLKEEIRGAYGRFRDGESETFEIIEREGKGADEYISGMESLRDTIFGIRAQGETLEEMMPTYDTWLREWETEEQYNHRNERMDDETEEQFETRRALRRLQVEQQGVELGNSIIVALEGELDKVGWKVDPMTARSIRSLLGGMGRPRDIIRRAVENSGMSALVKGRMMGLKSDLSNFDEVREGIASDIETSERARYMTALASHLNSLRRLTLKSLDGREWSPVDWVDEWNGLALNMPLTDFYDALMEYAERGGFDPVSGTDAAQRESLGEDGMLERTLDRDSMDALTDALRHIVEEAPYGTEIYDGRPLSDFLYKEDMGVNPNDFGEMIDNYLAELRTVEQNSAAELYDRIRNSRILKFEGRLSSELKNPVEEMLNALAERRGETPAKGYTDILRAIWDKYDTIDEVGSFVIDEVEQERMDTLKALIDELDTYIDAASRVPGARLGQNPIGHNVSINEFAERHADRLESPWRRLPEIRSDLAAEYRMMLMDAREELDRWTRLSDRLQVDKEAKIRATDDRIARMQLNTLDGISKEDFQINGRTYNLASGFGAIDRSGIMSGGAMQVKALQEQAVYKVVAQIAEDNGLKVWEAVTAEDCRVLDMLYPDWRSVSDQNTTSVSDSMSVEDTPYSRLMYLLTVMCEPPSRYYRQMRERMEGNGKLPIAAQELGMRMGRALFSGNLAPMVEAVYSRLDEHSKPMLRRTLVVMGAAGVGKTFAIMSALSDYLEGKVVFCVGPSDTTARNLMDKLGLKDTSKVRPLTIRQFFSEILKGGEKAYNGLVSEVETVPEKDGEFKHFTTKKINGWWVVNMKPGAVEFSDLSEKPFAILVDECTNLSAVEGLLLDEYADQIEAHAVFAGDFTQRTKYSRATRIGSVSDADMFAMRAPELLLSMRNTNNQKYRNQNSLKAVIDMMVHDLSDRNVSGFQFKSNYDKYANIAKKVQPSYYDGESHLNGLRVVDTLDSGLLEKLRALSESKVTENGSERAATVAFIGDLSGDAKRALEGAGVKIVDGNWRDFEHVLGDEFDYVVADVKLDQRLSEFVKNGESEPNKLLDLLRLIYTIDTRSRNGTVMIDNGYVRKYIGDNVRAEHTAMAPDVLANLDAMRAAKKAQLDELLRIMPDVAEPKGSDAPMAVDSQDIEKVVNDPEEMPGRNDDYLADIDNIAYMLDYDANMGYDIEDAADEDADDVMSFDEGSMKTGLSALVSYNLPVYSITRTESGRIANHLNIPDADGNTDHKVNFWLVDRPKDGVLRNMQCLYTEGELRDLADGKVKRVGKFADKLAEHRRLAKVRSAALFNHTYEELDADMKALVSKENWDNRRVALEFRLSDQNDVKPFGGMRRMNGMKPASLGATRPFWANYVLYFEGNDLAEKGRTRTMAFDLAGINDPDTLARNAESLVTKYAEAADKSENAGDGKMAEELRGRSANVVRTSEEYAKWFGGMYGAFSGGGFKDMLFDVTDDVVPTMRTWWVRRTKAPLRLDGYVDPSSPDTADGTSLDCNNFVLRNPDFVVSQPYVLYGDHIERFGLSPAIKRCAVVFVSADTTIPKERLAQTYADQRAALMAGSEPGRGVPKATVRMVMLRNYGLTLRQLLDLQYMESVGATITREEGDGEGERVHKPLNMSYMGFGMFKSMWNARVAVNEFCDRVKKWRGDNRLSVEQARAVTEAYDIYNVDKRPGRVEEARKRLVEAGLSAEEKKDSRGAVIGFRLFDALDELNGKVLRDVRLFRLGSYRNAGGRNYGYHVQRYYDLDKAMYKGSSEANLLAITETAAQSFRTMLDEFLEPLTRKGGIFEMKRYVRRRDGSERIVHVEAKNYIDELKEDSRDGLRTLAGVLTSSGEKSSARVGNVEYGSHDYFNLIPWMIRKVSRKAYRMLYGSDLAGNEGSTMEFTYSMPGDGGGKVNGTVQFDLNGMIGNASGEGGGFINMLETLFHGTLENPHRTYGKGSAETGILEKDAGGRPIMRLDDAYFKQGFFISPGVTKNSVENESRRIRVQRPAERGGNEVLMDMVECLTDGVFFGVDVNMRGAAYEMSGERLTGISPADRITLGELMSHRAKAATPEPEPEPESPLDAGAAVSAEIAAMKARFGAMYAERDLAKMASEYARAKLDEARSGLDAEGAYADEELKIGRRLRAGGYSVEEDKALVGNVVDAEALGGYTVADRVEDASLEPGTARVLRAYAVRRAGRLLGTYVDVAEGPSGASVPEPAGAVGAGPFISGFRNGAGEGFDAVLSRELDGRRKGNLRSEIVAWGAENKGVGGDVVAKRFLDGLRGMLKAESRDGFGELRGRLLGNDAYDDLRQIVYGTGDEPTELFNMLFANDIC